MNLIDQLKRDLDELRKRLAFVQDERDSLQREVRELKSQRDDFAAALKEATQRKPIWDKLDKLAENVLELGEGSLTRSRNRIDELEAGLVQAQVALRETVNRGREEDEAIDAISRLLTKKT